MCNERDLHVVPVVDRAMKWYSNSPNAILAILGTQQVGMAVVHPAVAAPEALFKHEGGDVAFSEFKDVITNKATTVVSCSPAASPLNKTNEEQETHGFLSILMIMVQVCM